jgi:hypothetical protein
MAKSKQVTDWLEAQRRVLFGDMEQLVAQIEVFDKIIKEAPTRTFQAHGRKWRVSTADQRLIQESEDAWLRLCRVGQKLREIEFQLSPPKGRPKGSRNKRSKLPDPTIVAALKDLESASGPKPDDRVLAVRHCKDKTEKGRTNWIYRLKKAKTNANRSRP